MFYKHENIILELTGSKGTLFIDDKLIFKGNYSNDVSDYNKKHQITDYRLVLNGLRIFPRVQKTAQM